MATNPSDEQIILVRGSAAHKEYMRHHFGWLKDVVNGVEDGLSISGRNLLLIFILYTTIKAGLTSTGRDMPWWLDTAMLAFQVCGLEGAIPGLSRLRETLLATPGDAAKEDAETVRKAILSARWLNMLTGVEVLLAAYSAFQFQPVRSQHQRGRDQQILRLCPAIAPALENYQLYWRDGENGNEKTENHFTRRV